ncbi:MAG: caspase family protein [Acidobacteriaceae bacterium]|nr:caspase family protein [Acidobacteriaceae bacterium]MBV9779487.1 caspase family protein [Acidobacteriaceae bacterium]
MVVRFGVLAAFMCAASFSQQSSGYFELIVPPGKTPIGGGKDVTVDIPAEALSRMMIQVLGSADRNLGYGDVHVCINGKGAGNIFNSGSNERGKFLAMDPSTLRMRPDPLFEPAVNRVEVYGKDKRSRVYYQNWILRSGVAANPDFRFVSRMSPSDESGVPPDLNLDEPNAPPQFAGGAESFIIQLKGTASAASGVESLSVDGRVVANAAGPLKLSFMFNAPVSRGQKEVTVEAIDKKGNRRSVSIPIEYPHSESHKLRLAGERFALLIGVSQFSAGKEGPPPLPGAAYDAKQLADTLKEHGFSDANIRLLTDEQATAEQIRAALGDFAAQAKPEDFLLIYFATQGAHDPLSPNQVYLMASDSRRRSLSETAIKTSELQFLLNKSIRCRHTLLFFDAQHPLGPDWAFPGKSLVNAYLLDLFDEPTGRSILVSGSAGQDSQEAKTGELSRNFFARALIEGLSGTADSNHTGLITARALCAYVAQSVQRSSGGLQTPQYRFTEAEEPVLSLEH